MAVREKLAVEGAVVEGDDPQAAKFHDAIPKVAELGLGPAGVGFRSRVQIRRIQEKEGVGWIVEFEAVLVREAFDDDAQAPAGLVQEILIAADKRASPPAKGSQ